MAELNWRTRPRFWALMTIGLACFEAYAGVASHSPMAWKGWEAIAGMLGFIVVPVVGILTCVRSIQTVIKLRREPDTSPRDVFVAVLCALAGLLGPLVAFAILGFVAAATGWG